MQTKQKTPPAEAPKGKGRDKKKAFLYHLRKKRIFAAAFESHGLTDVAKALRDCTETESLIFCSECGHNWYVPTKCRSRVCPICAWRMTQERAAYMEEMCKNMTHPKMLTLTMPTWTESPRDGIAFLRKSFTALRNRKIWRNVKGGAYQIELKPKDNGWHIHVHVILDSPFLPYQQLFSAWRDILKIPAPQIDIRAVPTRQARAYACKYAAKGADYDGNPDAIVQWYIATQGSRLWATFGAWYRVPKALLFAEEDGDDGPQRCPNCGRSGCIAFARDGPFILGPEAWQHYQQSVLSGIPFTQALPLRKEVLKSMQSNISSPSSAPSAT